MCTMASGQARQRSFLARLRRNTEGNTLAIIAAAMIPLTAMIGSGVDMSRAYLAQTRLQQACDAASLAGRRVLMNNNLNDTVQAEALKFFNFNFRQRSFETAPFTPSITQPKNGVVRITASTTMPTAVMKLFGYTTLPIATTCDASQNFVNTDVILVLDTTGSMMCLTTESSCNTSGPERTDSKIVSLRAAVLAFYDQLKPIQDELARNGLRLRYGVVPYSSAVNIGYRIREVNPDFLVSDQWTYQSRSPRWKWTQTSQTSSYVVGPMSINNVTRSQCNAYAAQYSGYNKPATEAYSSDGKTKTVEEQKLNYNWVRNNNNNIDSGTCSGNVTRTVTTYRRDLDYWIYEPVTHDVATYVTGAPTPVPTENNNSTATWAGCIEERDTVSTINGGSGLTIPSGALDLNTELVPTSDAATKWRPYWPEVSWLQNGGKPQVACPTESMRPQVWTRTAMSNYLNRLRPDGGTYHDNGMRWGARMISPRGIFAADNPSVFNGMPVNRFIIFMTDGLTDTGPTLYGSYGIEQYDKRITGGYTGSTDMDTRHIQRFRMACEAAKAMRDENGNQTRTDIWVIAFAQALDSALTDCASNPGQAKTVEDRDNLIQQFTNIGKTIGALRLTQ